MKRLSHLHYGEGYNHHVLYYFIHKTARGKMHRKQVRHALKHIDECAHELGEMLRTGNYDLKPTHNRIVNDSGKEREITVSPFFPNQVLDNILVHELKPLFERIFYTFSIGNVRKRGISYGFNYLKSKTKRYEYYLKHDIHHFYQTTRTELVKKELMKRIKDKGTLKLFDAVIGKEEFLDIGSVSSQGLSNFYLTKLDYFIKQRLHIPVYVRNVDDMVLMSNDREQLERANVAIKELLAEMGLTLKYHGTVRRFSDSPLSFIGFRFMGKRTELRTKIIRNLKRAISKAKDHFCNKVGLRLMSYFGWLACIKGGYCFYKKEIYPIIRKGKLRRIPSEENQSQTPCPLLR